jgi:hypothetical protein
MEERTQALDRVIAKARVSFPSEDGWVVLNLARMEQLIDEVNSERDELIKDEDVHVESAAAPVTSGSLAEAIVTRNVAAALQMTAQRPMIALADAAADFDLLYRYRQGEQVSISEMLKAESVRLSLQQVKDAISALTSALDGTYTDEASAVKMAIMKAVKALG